MSPREVYANVTNKQFIVYENVGEKLLEVFNITRIQWVCYKESPCLPSELLNYYRYLKDTEMDMNLIEASFAKTPEIIKDEKQ